MLPPRLVRSTRRPQRGVYAIEFALVFLFFFGLLYAVLCYGILIAVRVGIQNAAEEGARAGLRYQPNWSERLRGAETETNLRLTWMKYPLHATAQLCQMGPAGTCSDGTGAVTPLERTPTLNQICQIVVSVQYAPYGDASKPWLPPLPGALLPGDGLVRQTGFKLVGQASMLLDGRSM